MDVFAAEAALLDELVDEIADRDGAAGDVQPVALWRRPLEAFASAREQPVASGEVRFSKLRQTGQEAAVGLVLVGRAVDDDENGNGTDRAGEAGADQPAEAAALAALGVVGLV